MFNRITRAVLAHKQLFIAAIAISALMGYASPLGPFLQNAAAQSLPDFVRNLIPPINIDRQIQIPVGQYGNVVGLPEPREVNISPPSLEDRIQIRIGWSFI
jgi:hypothetical protein